MAENDYGGTGGNNVNNGSSSDTSAAPAMDSNGNAIANTINLSAINPEALAGLSALGIGFGLPALNPNGTSVGIVDISGAVIGAIGPDGINFAGFNVQPTGAIVNANGVGYGFLNMQQNDGGFAIEPFNLDSIGWDVSINSITVTEEDDPSPGAVQAEVFHQINSLVNGSNGSVMHFAWPAQRKLQAGTCAAMFSSIGIPIMDYANVTAMFSKHNSFMLANFIGGLDGIYSLRTGKRVVPPQGPSYPAPKGFSIGQYANYAESYLLLACSSAGYEVIMGGTGDYINCIDPSTGKTLVPAAYAWMKIFNGSQQINLVLQPTYQYTGPNPTAANPGYNSSINNVFGISNYINNLAIMTQNQYIQMNPAANPGGPDGGGIG